MLVWASLARSLSPMRGGKQCRARYVKGTSPTVMETLGASCSFYHTFDLRIPRARNHALCSTFGRKMCFSMLYDLAVNDLPLLLYSRMTIDFITNANF